MVQRVDLNELIQSQGEGIGMQGFLESAVAAGGGAAGRSVTGGEVFSALTVSKVWRAPQISTCGDAVARQEVENVARQATCASIATPRFGAAGRKAAAQLGLRPAEDAIRGDAKTRIHSAQRTEGPTAATGSLVVDAANHLTTI